MLSMSWFRSLKTAVSKKRKLVGLILLIFGGQVLMGAVLPDLIAQPLQMWWNQQMTAVEVGFLVASYSSLLMIGGPIFGQMTDKYGAKKMIFIVYPLLLGIMLLVYPLAQSTGDYVIVRGLNAILFSSVANAPMILIRGSIPQDRRVQARVNGAINAGCYLGSGLALMTGVLLADNPPLLWSSVAVVGVTSVTLTFWGIQLLSGSETWIKVKKRLISKVFVFANGMFVWEAFIITLPSIGVSATLQSFLTWFANYVGQQAGIILLISTFTNVLSLLTYMPVLLVRKGYRFVIWSSLLILMVALILIWIGGSFWILMSGGVLVGVALAGNSLSLSEEIYSRVPSRRLGAGFATSGFFRQLGGVVGGILYSSLMWSVLGSKYMWISLLPIPMLSMVSLVVMRFVKRKTPLSLDNTAKIMMELFGYVLAGQHGKFSLTVSKYPELSGHIKRVHKFTPWLKSRDTLEYNTMIIRKLEHIFKALALLEVVVHTNRQKKWIDDFPEKEIITIRSKLFDILKEIETQNLHSWYKFWLSSTFKESHQELKERGLVWGPDDKAENMLDKLLILSDDYYKRQITEKKEISDCLYAVHLLTGIIGKEITNGKWSRMLVAGATG
jgi:MFS family permease